MLPVSSLSMKCLLWGMAEEGHGRDPLSPGGGTRIGPLLSVLVVPLHPGSELQALPVCGELLLLNDTGRCRVVISDTWVVSSVLTFLGI